MRVAGAGVWGLGLRSAGQVSYSYPTSNPSNPQNDEWGALHASGLHVTGRILLNLWRVLRGELKLGSYSFESCCAAVLGLRVPRVREQQLALWFAAGGGGKGGACNLQANGRNPCSGRQCRQDARSRHMLANASHG